MLRGGAVCALALLAVVALAAPESARAQQMLPGGVPAPVLPTVATDAPVLLEADSLTYDSRTEMVIATGNATVYYGDYTVRADRITYDRNTDTVIAFGNVRLTEPGGTVLTATEIELTDELREGFINSVSVVLSNNARIAAAQGRRAYGNITEFDSAVYTACEPCEEDPTKPLTWQLTAVKVRHDQLAKIVEYEDVTLELFGVPVAYAPYFFHPDPTVKRQSGFLPPRFFQSSFFGFGAQIPYFWNIAPNYDVTFRPLITTGQGPLFDFEWRHRTSADGYYTIRPTFIWQADPAVTPPGDETFRGSINTRGNYQINQAWKWGWDVTAVTDDTYLRRYGINSDPDLSSELFLEGLAGRNFFAMRGYKFDGLLAADDDATLPLVHPIIDHNYIFEQPVWGGELSLDTQIASLSRDTGADSTRASTDLTWQRDFITPEGMVMTPFWSLRGDIYSVDNHPNPFTAGGVTDETFARFRPMGGLEFRYPLARVENWGTLILEPIAQIIVRPDETHVADTPNEDAISLNFEAASLFDWDKFSGIDRYEGGTRANIGFRHSLADSWGGNTTFTFGQSYHLAGDNSYGPGTGLDEGSSDLVSSFVYRPDRRFSFGWRGRFDNSSFDLKVNEVSLAADFERFNARLAYSEVETSANQVISGRNEEVNGQAKFEVVRYWSLLGGATYDLENSDLLRQQYGIAYEDECFVAQISYEETMFDDRDIDPEQKVMLSFLLKTLGGTSFSQSVGN
jgi:LPS-assembly protein